MIYMQVMNEQTSISHFERDWKQFHYVRQVFNGYFTN